MHVRFTARSFLSYNSRPVQTKNVNHEITMETRMNNNFLCYSVKKRRRFFYIERN